MTPGEERSQQASELVVALCSNQVAQGLELLAAEPGLATADFYAACACGELEFAERALAQKPELAQEPGGPNGWPPLVYVCFSRTWRRDPARAARLLETARRLLANGADPNGYYMGDPDGTAHPQTCLFAAAGIANHAALTRLLLEAGANVDEVVTEEARRASPPRRLGEFGQFYPQEALYHACEFPDVSCLRLLLEAKPLPLSVSYCFGRALDFAHEEAALLFLEYGADPSLTVPWHKNRSHLHKAVLHRRSASLVRRMLERGADPSQPDDAGLSPYRYAIRQGAEELAALFEEWDASPYQITEEDHGIGLAALGRRAGSWTPDPELLARAARKGDVAEMTRLIAAGADINAALDVPPLHSACYAGHLEAAQLLVRHGASLTIKNAFGGTPLGTCIYGSTDCFDVEGGPSACPPDEVPPRDYAQLAHWLITQGSPRPAWIWGGSQAVKAVLRQHGISESEPQNLNS